MSESASPPSPSPQPSLIILFNLKMATRSLCRPVMRSATRRSPAQAYFSSSSIVRDAQNQQDKYTHFGFENVKAEEKEHKGMQ